MIQKGNHKMTRFCDLMAFSAPSFAKFSDPNHASRTKDSDVPNDWRCYPAFSRLRQQNGRSAEGMISSQHAFLPAFAKKMVELHVSIFQSANDCITPVHQIWKYSSSEIIRLYSQLMYCSRPWFASSIPGTGLRSMVIPSLSRPDPLELSWFIMFPLKRLQLGVSPGDIPKLVRHNHFWNHRRQLGANPLAPTGLQKKDGYYSYRHPQKGRKIKSHWYRDKSYCSTFLEIPKNLKLTDFGGFIGGSISTFWGSGPFQGTRLDAPRSSSMGLQLAGGISAKQQGQLFMKIALQPINQ